jgi:hypothetical protein
LCLSGKGARARWRRGWALGFCWEHPAWPGDRICSLLALDRLGRGVPHAAGAPITSLGIFPLGTRGAHRLLGR